MDTTCVARASRGTPDPGGAASGRGPRGRWDYVDREPGRTVAPQVDGFPGYVVRAELGRGADATVLRVQRTADGGTYALKVIDRPADETAVALCREAALLAAVNHPDLVRIHEVGRHDGRPYLVMDLVEGRALARLLHDGPLPADRVVSLALELADPLAAIHRAGLVHRDIKPDNIMVQPDGRARLIDFGMAARETNEGSETAVGTLLYSSPEQAGTLRRPVDQRSDLYSLGVVLYECLAGRPPFATSDVGDLLRMHAVEPPPDLLGFAPETPADLASIVARLLAKEPDDRYQTGADLVVDLMAVSGPAPEPAADLTRKPLVGRSDRAGPARGPVGRRAPGRRWRRGRARRRRRGQDEAGPRADGRRRRGGRRPLRQRIPGRPGADGTAAPRARGVSTRDPVR